MPRAPTSTSGSARSDPRKAPPKPDAKPGEAGLAGGELMRRAIAKLSPVRTIGNCRSPPKRAREGRALPVLRAVPSPGSRAFLREPGAASFVTKHDKVLP